MHQLQPGDQQDTVRFFKVSPIYGNNELGVGKRHSSFTIVPFFTHVSSVIPIYRDTLAALITNRCGILSSHDHHPSRLKATADQVITLDPSIHFTQPELQHVNHMLMLDQCLVTTREVYSGKVLGVCIQ